MAREIRITPSILNADFSRLQEEIGKISAVSDLLHLDVMDNVFVPNFTFDFDSASKIIKESSLEVDAHLMVADVDHIAPDYAQAGCASVTIHAEATKDIVGTLREIRKVGSRSGLALKPASQIEDYVDVIDEVDMFLIMTVEPGFGGQKFMTDMLSKISRTRAIIGSRPIWLQVDGGISLQTIEIAADAGADTFVAGSAVFSAQDPAAMVTSLRELACKS
ncbi:MAG: ribulose-phosphate 3-epimerase [Actinobacteria bacterium]|uniref:ribulose-phosphate 3-epimerase n=1 Tax=freshwater metagenome TaxID=449393 RepID=A0A6J7PUF4_9ZZZZ|nr:ribulose-phosphate 3-epimerase [Actinomycetota bacterium]